MARSICLSHRALRVLRTFHSSKSSAGFFFIGGRPADLPANKAIPNHSPYFFIDEGALRVHAMSRLAADYLRAGAD